MATAARAFACPKRAVESAAVDSLPRQHFSPAPASGLRLVFMRVLRIVANSWAARQVEAYSYFILALWSGAFLYYQGAFLTGGLQTHISQSAAAAIGIAITLWHGAGLICRVLKNSYDRPLRKWGSCGMAIFFGGLAGEFAAAIPTLPEGLGVMGLAGFGALAVSCLCGYIRLELLADGDVSTY